MKVLALSDTGPGVLDVTEPPPPVWYVPVPAFARDVFGWMGDHAPPASPVVPRHTYQLGWCQGERDRDNLDWLHWPGVVLLYDRWHGRAVLCIPFYRRVA
jgi:hypothetical protein